MPFELPGPQNDGDPTEQFREQAEKVLAEPDQDQGDDGSDGRRSEEPADGALRQAVNQRA
ncbi:hypothetical protein Q3V23_00125 [Streptomyces sp. VNUA116]|uniref:hypothetical protein n=1 Tax=Streptomyces sp. VNUA116 TaxID=3062449 RepID=UPI0026753724|nr:hypothetical protein [Streptomyces sp. VNUA116]WKU42605.1 hypothetical protein Q3V23_00125 [Streptomyces sp. VNUA116]